MHEEDIKLLGLGILNSNRLSSPDSQLNCSNLTNKLNKDFGREELIEKFPTARTFPQIKIDGQPIGGWAEFKEI